MFLSYSTIRFLLTIFPVIPLFFIVIILPIHYLVKKDITKISLILCAFIQLIIGVMIIMFFSHNRISLLEPVSQWSFGIKIYFDFSRISFLIAYLIPLFFTIVFVKRLKSFNIKLVFLFFLSGCSGILISGDIFNFYVYYELMIMSAYILISIEGKFYYSVKYMIFSAISSFFLLLAIIVTYVSGLGLSISSLEMLGQINPVNAKVILTLFCFAFLLKGAFFPITSLVNCHAVTTSIISAFLSSFTIFSSIFGLYYFVVIPSTAIDFVLLIKFIRLISFVTLIYSSIRLLFEFDMRKLIAGSTAFSLAFCGIMLSFGQYNLTLLYVAFHALYKTGLFMQYDNLIEDKLNLYINKKSFFLYVILVLFSLGFYPGILFFIKESFFDGNLFYYAISYLTTLFAACGFFKFTFNFSKIRTEFRIFLLFLSVLILSYILNPLRVSLINYQILVDFFIIVIASLLAPGIYKKTYKISKFSRNLLLKNLNYELLYIFLFVFMAGYYLIVY